VGAFGPAVFSDDLAMDVRGAYRELLEDGATDGDAVDRVMEQFAESLADPDNEAIVVIALAISAWKLGRLSPELRDRAIGLLDAGRGVERWEDDPKLLRKRVVALQKARARLAADQPDRKRVRRPARHVTSLVPGDVLSYRVDDGDFIALRVMRLDEKRQWVAPVLQVVEWRGVRQPTEREVEASADLPMRLQVTGVPHWWLTRSTCFGRRGHDYSDLGFLWVGTIARRPGDDDASWGSYGGWEGLVAGIRHWAPRVKESRP
jgi:hypothetical protein